jgi:hypothetical protein
MTKMSVAPIWGIKRGFALNAFPPVRRRALAGLPTRSLCSASGQEARWARFALPPHGALGESDGAVIRDYFSINNFL